MSHVHFHDYVMFCNSTGNQTGNLLPILQLQCKQLVIISTGLTEKNGSTQRLIDILGKKNVETEKILINENEEKNLNDLTNKIIHKAKGYSEIVWNISGGQKIPLPCCTGKTQQWRNNYI